MPEYTERGPKFKPSNNIRVNDSGTKQQKSNETRVKQQKGSITRTGKTANTL